MLNIDQPYAYGLRVSLQGFVRYEGRHPSDAELESILCEELEAVSVYTEDLVDIWKDTGYPEAGNLEGYHSIESAIRDVVSETWHSELMPQARCYLERLV